MMTKELLEIYNNLLDALLTKKMGRWKSLLTTALEKAYWIGHHNGTMQMIRAEYQREHEDNNL